MKTPPIILIEFNELCPHLLDRWMATGELPNFQRLYESSVVYVTTADEKEAPNLQPWIQWFSIHTGLPFKDHGVFRLTEGARSEHRTVWDVLSSHAFPVMNFSSMNCKPFDLPGCLYFPDPWNDAAKCSPSELEPFRRFLVKAIQQQASTSWTAREIAQLTSFLLRHGLRLRTVFALIDQFLREQFTSRPASWRRVRLMDRLSIDVFHHYYTRIRPSFATFFSNSTAHLQHAYWRYLEPERFSEAVSNRNTRAFENAIKYGYVCMDQMIGEFLAMARTTGAKLMFASGLSQQAYTEFEGKGGRHYYRPRDIGSLLRVLGLAPISLQPVMAQQFIASFNDEAATEDAKSRLLGLEIENRTVFNVVNASEPNSLLFGSHIYSALTGDARLQYAVGGALDGAAFFDHFYELEATKSGKHHPDGCFWIQTGTHVRQLEKISILDIAPTILNRFNVTAAWMQGTVR